MKYLKYDKHDLINVCEQLDPTNTEIHFRNKLNNLDDTQYARYINTYYMLKEVSKRLDCLDSYLNNDITNDKLESMMQNWTTDLYDKS